jgi:DNA polymerase-3 subunit delta'
MDAWRSLSSALANGRLHHALLFAAPAGMGKRALVDAFAGAALCERRDAQGFACGACRACMLVAAGSHPDLVRVGLELRDDGKQRTEITIDQMRALSQRLSMSSQFGGLQIALVDPADRLNASAANGLLKTLEEPAASTVIVLVADDAARLPATIRSRCQRIDLREPSREEALAWLRGQGSARSKRAKRSMRASAIPAARWPGVRTRPCRCANPAVRISLRSRAGARARSNSPNSGPTIAPTCACGSPRSSRATKRIAARPMRP